MNFPIPIHLHTRVVRSETVRQLLDRRSSLWEIGQKAYLCTKKFLLFNFLEISRSYFSCDCFLCSNSAPWHLSGVRQCRSYRTRKIVQLEETLVWRFVQHCRSTRARGEEEKEKHPFGYFSYVARIAADVSIPHAGVSSWTWDTGLLSAILVDSSRSLHAITGTPGSTMVFTLYSVWFHDSSFCILSLTRGRGNQQAVQNFNATSVIVVSARMNQSPAIPQCRWAGSRL